MVLPKLVTNLSCTNSIMQSLKNVNKYKCLMIIPRWGNKSIVYQYIWVNVCVSKLCICLAARIVACLKRFEQSYWLRYALARVTQQALMSNPNDSIMWSNGSARHWSARMCDLDLSSEPNTPQKARPAEGIIQSIIGRCKRNRETLSWRSHRTAKAKTRPLFVHPAPSHRR